MGFAGQGATHGYLTEGLRTNSALHHLLDDGTGWPHWLMGEWAEVKKTAELQTKVAGRLGEMQAGLLLL